MIKKYQDKKWLENKYSKKKLSTRGIAKLCKTTHETILYWLKKFNIPRRSCGYAHHLAKVNHCNLSQKAIEWINGELLGDGCLQSLHPYSAKFSYSSKYLEYINYVSDTLKSFGIEQTGKIRKIYHKGRDYYSYNYQSLNYTELLSLRKKWYPNGKKIVPKDIKLTPLTLRQHYIGDGSLQHTKTGKPYIELYTCGFIISDVEWLVMQLIKLGFKVIRCQSNNSIYISIYSTKDFLNYIGKCPVNCYSYKWTY